MNCMGGGSTVSETLVLHPLAPCMLAHKRRRPLYRSDASTTRRLDLKTFSAAGFGAASHTELYQAHIPAAPDLDGKSVRAAFNSTSMAFLGDSVWELYARRKCLLPPSRTTTYYERVVATVRAEQQDLFFGVLCGGTFLTDEERDIIRWAGNGKILVPPRLSKSGAHKKTYVNATKLECLVGWLYLTNPQRLHELMCHLGLA